MLNICYKFGSDNDIVSNTRKSVCFRVGRDWSKCFEFLIICYCVAWNSNGFQISNI